MCSSLYIFFFFFEQKTAYELRISDWSSDVCSSDLDAQGKAEFPALLRLYRLRRALRPLLRPPRQFRERRAVGPADDRALGDHLPARRRPAAPPEPALRGGAGGHSHVRDPRLFLLAHRRAI